MAERLRRRRLDRASRREELIVAAERVLRERGLSARVEDVVRQAGAAQGTFYVYFRTWEDLLLVLRERAFEGFDSRFPKVEALRSAEDWRAMVAALPALFTDLTLELEGLHAVLFHGPIARVPPTEPRHDVMARLADLFVAGTQAGALSVPQPRLAARLAFAMLHETADLVEAGADRARTTGGCAALLSRALLA